ncbi:hypothetical protein J6524_04875 [Bradyrhizobium sp. WSM 1738]|uniref:hypothetical protein n=1 Tax=Bradyrhizobium hereditatis TaxID=2821405 RepID=UPI001CE264F1|nr:hypothetical protein [Bradyrhizobium hereditatis]MCA6114262.1 hypothetical protein [Bradyrhizobium hereditatis]
MIVSHWGIFPGFLRPKRFPFGELIGLPQEYDFEPVDWETFLAAFEAIERADFDRAIDEARYLRRVGVAFH